MFKFKFKKMTSVVCSGIIAATALAAPVAVNMVPAVVTANAADNNYAKLLQYSLYFYDANMCGSSAGSSSAFSWRGACHTGDEVNGGFHDAGDHAMFGLPQGYTAATLGWSYYEFKDAFNATGQTAHFKTVSNYFNDFFKASTKLDGSGNVTSLLYQKGNGYTDHDYWGTPELQEQTQGKRQMYWASSGVSDVAAEYAASLALSYLNFGNSEDLKYAKALYDFSTKSNSNSTTLNGHQGFYDSDSFQDDQAFAAGWLYIATKDSKYKNDCASKQAQYQGWCHSWNNVNLGAACVNAEITGNWTPVTDWMSRYTNSSSYAFLDKWGSARLNASLQMTALIATKHGAVNWGDWAKGQMNFLLGENPSNTCFVAGYASNSAKNAHHRAASGWANYDEMNNATAYHPTNGHILTGALVGGPTDASGGGYTDSLTDYVANEVAIDYNAGLVGAAAGLYSIYRTGTPDSNVNGIGNVQIDIPVVTDPPVTTVPPVTKPNGPVTVTVGKSYTYSNMDENDRMIAFPWSDFGLSSTDKVEKVEVNISANGTIGKWQGAFGSSTSVAPEYWTQSADMEQTISGNKGTITWNVDSATADIIQYNYGGELKFGVWWIDCNQFKIDSVTVYTKGSSTTPIVTTAPPVVTTAKPTTPAPSNKKTITVNDSYNYNTMTEKMITFPWSDFGLSVTDKVEKVEVKLSANGTIGKWQGAFGTSTSVAPDYWTQSADMEQTISGNSGTITWNVDSATADIIQYNYGGELKFGVWWIDNAQFKVDSVTVYTKGSSTTPVVTTTTAKPTTPVVTTTTTQPPVVNFKYGDADGNGKVEINDAVLIMSYVSNKTKYPLTGNALLAADVYRNGDGISNMDALSIQKYLSDFITKLPES